MTRKLKNISTINASLIGRPQIGKYKTEVFQELGQFVEITAKIPHRLNLNVSSFIHWIKPAILHDQYLLIKNDGDLEPSGYVLWAWVSAKTLDEFFTKERFVLHPMCWNEGEHLIIVDFAIANKSFHQSVIRSLYRKARNQADISYKTINICIRDNVGSIIKHNRKNAYEQ
ncbi:toxin-activating lysine-acyltransferase [Vibrio jasicida]|uniref:toxin-activating lysine-acyltransferase n=1 Tax=Vibrio jasicida TaxID=766224 RepID=UPI0005EFADE5|nr:toxin-activating lysine-acyltransferase [Vibrio jasicida]